MTDTHPARSPEFLSRFYDGELTAAEARNFDAHRSSCSECRATVEEFERTLSAYRAAPTAAPASDLSARILRKIRAQAPARRPFGVMFGIDIRWAGVFAMALIVTILATSLVSQRRALAPRPVSLPTGPTTHLVDEPAAQRDEPRRSRAPARREDALAPKEPAAAAPAEPPAEKAKRLEADAPPAAPAPAPPVFAAEGSETGQRKSLPSAKEEQEAASPALRRNAATSEPSGGEAGSIEARVPLHLVIRALDGHGEAPALAANPAEDRLAALRGGEFVLLVESQGRVRSVEVRDGASLRKDLATDAAIVLPDLAPLRDLRFAPGDRPRRLLVRVE